MAKSIVAAGYGGPEVLSLVDLPEAPPGPGEVTVGVRAAGVNPADVKSYGGAWGKDPARLPMRLGFEVAGVVLQVGDGAEGPAGPLSVGDEVVAYRVTGGYAERITVPADAVLPRPAEVPVVEAAGLLLVAATAYHALEAVAAAGGETVLIHAASGGVGSMAARLARHRGLRVIGTASPRRHDDLREAGVVPVAYGDGLLARVREAAGASGVDAAVDAAGTDEALDVSTALVADPHRIATVANFGPRAAEAGIRRLGSGPGADPGTELRRAARPLLLDLAARGVLPVRVAATFPLAEAADAHRLLLSGRADGKIVLLPEA